MTIHLLGVFTALAAAVMAGGSDFCGGFATRRHNQFQVLWLSYIAGIFILVTLALLLGEGLSSAKSILYASLAGVSGAIAITVLYSALAVGRAAVVSPTSAVVGVAIPVIFAAIVEGLPGLVTLTGFIVAVIGTWLTTRTQVLTRTLKDNSFFTGILAGVAFGSFYIFIAQIEPGHIFTPLAFSKLSSASVALFFLLLKKIPLPRINSNRVALLAGFLDAITNV